MSKPYSKGEIDYPEVGIITDEETAKFVKEHTHWWERLNYHRISDYTIAAQLLLMKIYDAPKKEKWFFREDFTEMWD